MELWPVHIEKIYIINFAALPLLHIINTYIQIWDSRNVQLTMEHEPQLVTNKK
jgi:hypothetical protein